MIRKTTHFAAVATLIAGAMPNLVAADNVPLNLGDATNGITDIFSATFDGALDPNCATAPDPDECAFFKGHPPAGREITIDPNPSGVDNGAPRGITPQPPNGSFLDLDLGVGNTQLTLNTGVVYIQHLAIVISGGTPDATTIQAFDIGIELKNFAPRTVPIDANGVAIFEIDTQPTISADFSTFSIIVDLANDCTGNLCALIPILTLDMIRFRLIVDYDATFGSFTADFVGQTANNSMVYMTLNSGVPSIGVTDSVAPAGDRVVPFGDVTETSQANQTVTVANTGTGDLAVGSVTPPPAPFSIASDLCSNKTLAPGASCALGVRFAPTATGAFSGSFDILSNDALSPNVTVSLSGTGTALPVPDIAVTDSIPPVDDQDMPFGNVTVASLSDATVTIRNDGNADLDIFSIAQLDALALPFSLIDDACSLVTLAPGANCSLTIRFAPTVVGDFGDSFDIPSNDSDEASISVTVSGTGAAVAMPDITVIDSIAPADDLRLTFGDIWQDFSIEETITVRNDGNADLVIGDIAAPAAPFAIVSDACSGRTIAATMSCAVDVSFNPTTVATFTDSLDIPSNDTDEANVVVNLSGAGVPPDPGEKLPGEPSGADGGFFGSGLDPQTLLVLLLIPVLRARRRSAGVHDRHAR